MTFLIVWHLLVVKCSLFADNCPLYRQISSLDNYCILQDDLLKIGDWANTWKMVYNIDKCKVLQISLSSSTPVTHYL